MGSVTLVGAGCGKDLITVKGLKAVRSADVIVYDDLIDNDLLNEIKPAAELIYVGKRFGSHSEKQEIINRLLIEKAKENKNVVRLKGGDSFVFGRGGEEIIALQKENVPYYVVPGISSSIAVPENSGIPVTHRAVAQSFTVVTGHTATDVDESYEALAKLKGTLVFLMGLHNIENICKRLIENEKDKDTPAAVISQGFSKNQKRINGTLENIAEKASLAQTPAVLVIGKVTEFDFQKTIKLPLEDVSVTVTGTKHFTSKLSENLTDLGAFVTSYPYLSIVPEFNVIPQAFEDYTYLVFTSSNGVKIFFDYLKKNRIDYRKISHLKFACIGDGSAKSLENYGFNADFIPSEYTAEMLGKELPKILTRSDKLLILRASKGSENLTAELNKSSVKYDDIKIYDTVTDSKSICIKTDYVTFSSASGVSAFFENGGRLNNAKPVCIGEITAKEFKKFSSITPLTAKTHTAEGVVSLILEDKNEAFQKTKTK